jgi:hypothetical protein
MDEFLLLVSLTAFHVLSGAHATDPDPVQDWLASRTAGFALGPVPSVLVYRRCGLILGERWENANRSRRAKAGPGFSSFVRPRPPVEIGWPPLLLPALDRDLGSVPFAGATSLLNVEPGHHGAQLSGRAEAPPPIL